ncbi:DnaB-like replicative helicase [Acinetobacter phage YMC11/12/R2315]|uniref:DNA 5'-3' helicase n=4 Tax=Obolenskvirus TaxID=1915205 RepID=A0A0D4DC26_9CAUD|nr:DnaB-like replicative helicase [Acinetobacter phage YMC-13-01-C62]YP_009203579.1 DnaB-like replicative helicase [Acinetobacter phage YMC11/12/R2315]AJT61440.1 putative replicative DNA helicase [Acinetobacter phage YMC11/12/R1215]WNT46075.1 putative replicative DNA helicase [Acinetobacter phage P115]AID17936.1 putative replicative DNA helicase [Acinetobacter phage YMC-13-01-C62]AJT61291.1 putative replicative DNA helicase [Acinetobacter phage YMC11/12/R2315]
MNENLYSIQIEQSVLSALMSLNGGIDDVVSKLTTDSFYATQHKIIFKHFKKLFDAGSGHDIVMVYDSIKLNANDSKIVDEDFLINLNSTIGLAHFLEQHADQLNEYASRRALFEAGERIKAISIDTTQYDINEAISKSESILENLSNQDEVPTLSDAYDVSVSLFASIDKTMEARKRGEKVDVGVKTGFMDLDRQLGQISKSDLVIIAARPSMGKTAFAQSLMLSVSFMQQHPVLFQSAEMSKEKIGQRLVASLASINLRDIRDSDIKNEDWEFFYKATNKLKASKLLIDDRARPSLSDIRKNCRIMKAKYGYVGAVFVDYLTLLKSPLSTDNNHLAVGAISKGLKAIAKEFDCPVFCLAQLSRSLESRKDRRPLMSDIRESGSIEEDADVIMFIYRDEYYDKNSKDQGIAEIIVAKARDGEVGTVRLATELQYSRFSNLNLEYLDI